MVSPALKEFLTINAMWVWQGYRYYAYVAWPLALLLAWQFGAFK